MRYINPRAKIGKNVYIGKDVKLYGPVKIGDRTIIYDNVILGVLSDTHKKEFETLIHKGLIKDLSEIVTDSLVIGKNCSIGENTIIGEGTKMGNNAFIEPNIQIGSGNIIGKNCLIEQRAEVYNNSKIGDYCWITGFISNFCVIEDYVFIHGKLIHKQNPPIRGISADYEERSSVIKKYATIGKDAILIGTNVGEFAYVGAGAVVTKDVPAREKWVGNPARKIADIKQKEIDLLLKKRVF